MVGDRVTLMRPFVLVVVHRAERERDRDRASGTAQLAWRSMRRRSRSDVPPHVPCLSPFASAYARHAARTGHLAQTLRPSVRAAPSSPKNQSLRFPRHAARSNHAGRPASMRLISRERSRGPQRDEGGPADRRFAGLLQLLERPGQPRLGLLDDR